MPSPRRGCLGVLLAILLVSCHPSAPESVGTGPAMVRPESLALTPDGRLLVADPGAEAVFEVDPATGGRQVLYRGPAPADAVPGEGEGILVAVPSRGAVLRVAGGAEEVVSRAGSRGRGPALGRPLRLARLSAGRLLVLDEERPGLVLVDIATGGRRPVGPALDEPTDLLVTGGRVLVVEETLARLLEVDLAHGEVRPAADLQSAGGPPLLEPGGLGAGGGGEVLLADTLTAEVVALRPDGTRRLAASPTEGSGVLMPQVQDAVSLPDGSVAVACPRAGMLVRVDPAGRRSVLSGPAQPEGNLALQPLALAPLPAGSPAVLDWASRSVYRLDPESGEATPITGSDRGAGPSLQVPFSLAGTGSGLLLLDRALGVLAVDPDTGDRARLHPLPPQGLPMALAADGSRAWLATLDPSGVWDAATGEAALRPDRTAGLVVAPDGSLLATDPGGGRVLRLAPGGEAGVLSGEGRGAGPEWLRPWAVAGLADGGAVVGDNDREALVRVDRAGNRTVLSATGQPPGPPLQGVQSLLVLPDGSLLVADPGGGGLLRVDPSSGRRTPVPWRRRPGEASPRRAPP